MASKIIRIFERLESPQYPLLGPNLQGLYWFGLWQCGNRIRDGLFNILHLASVLFVLSEFVELFAMEIDLMKILFNVSVTALSLVTVCKTVLFIYYLPHWKNLVNSISKLEQEQLKSKNFKLVAIIKRYTLYSRVITYSFWSVICITSLLTVTAPFLKYITSPSYRQSIQNGTELYPQILSSWFPFDKTKMPGYLIAVSIHIIMTTQGAAIVAVYDSTAVAIMSFLKGQQILLRYKCERIFGLNEVIPTEKVLANIEECHRLHCFLLEQHHRFNSITSPVMILYVLVCSVMMCCSVVQLSLGHLSTSEKLWVIEFTTALITQLFLYCWHSNEITYESNLVDRGVYASNWWRGDVKVKRQILILAGKLAPSLILKAGPVTTLSMATFISILKGSYSFYTLVTQMQENQI
ncbi:odorant receptor 82a-like [Danaus plexippus]|uniref:odorant receptor 82a-like n=1 Tax=Danaus plexippus TaxID=13037 RepID=UPI002AB2C4B0|nr:odorant receptor 82a-like [Danaus plexippus]